MNVAVYSEPGTGRSRGFGFVTFAEQSSADSAIQAMNDQELVRYLFCYLSFSLSESFVWAFEKAASSKQSLADFVIENRARFAKRRLIDSCDGRTIGLW